MKSDLLVEAFAELFPQREFTFNPKLTYSGRFKGYNGNIKLEGNTLTLSLSKQWRGVSRDIQKGIAQELLSRLFKTKKKTLSMDLYESFLKNVHHTIAQTKTHPDLQASFDRVNQQFFMNLMDPPNFVLGTGRAKLGSYEYGTDTIMISEILLEDEELLDYVMYHEMLHKKHKFSEGRHHTKAFREDEKKFGDIQELETRLGRLIRRAKRGSWLGW